MTKSFFVTLANMFRDTCPKKADYDTQEEYYGASDVWEKHLTKMMQICTENNPKFDKEKFLDAVYKP